MNAINERTPIHLTIRNAIAALILVLAASLLAASPVLADQDKGGHKSKMGGKMAKMNMQAKMAGCERNLMMAKSAEMQMGGAHYKGPMPKKGSMKMGGMDKGMKMDAKGKGKGMKMGGMKMGGKGKGMKMGGKGEEKAHADHEVKLGGVLFMAPNEMHHVEGVFSEQCGFQLFFYNAFTKPINAGRFRAFIKLIGEVDEEEVERIRFLRPNHKGNMLHTTIGHGLKAPFEIELYVKFPEGDEVEVFNFKVDAGGKIS